MTSDERTMSALWSARWQRWPRWVARATVLWAVLYAGFGLACALSGTTLLYHGTDSGTSRLGWVVMAVGVLAALASGAVVRYGLRPVLRGLLWVVCALAGVTAFSLLMDVITLMLGQGVDSRASAANKALAAVGAVLLAATAQSDRRPAGTVARAPSAAPRLIQRAAWAGTLAFVPYAAMKLVWAFGGTFAGITGEEMLVASERNGASEIFLTLESWGLDPTALLAVLGIFLLWGLVRPWGQVFPRWTLFPSRPTGAALAPARPGSARRCDTRPVRRRGGRIPGLGHVRSSDDAARRLPLLGRRGAGRLDRDGRLRRLRHRPDHRGPLVLASDASRLPDGCCHRVTVRGQSETADWPRKIATGH
ncbi:hypothetical protein MTF65_26000 [Streptomyces sp. APSN-46.1]|uniref:hypothetical protein n=1 Tax=Streptomyces sp. APSN-46.1 TaxID=2929049 RepID=UPI001FB4ED4D|nr:hypothetical protein [Streptomyces sp. APSN-46.1]MCJ1680737.1 hypothetical protein [Streptomyces sp. APSN-46.1]